MPAATPSSADRPKNRETENEDLKAPRDGGPPRAATEPAGLEGSSRTPKTMTDPASGETIHPTPAEQAHR